MSRFLGTAQLPSLAPPLLSTSSDGTSSLSTLQALAPASAPERPARSDSLNAATVASPSATNGTRPPASTTSSSSSVYPALLTAEDTEHGPTASTETLPCYSRRPPTAIAAEDEPPLKEFAFTSKSRKMSLRFSAAGEHNPVLVQPEPDARTSLKGNLVLTLPSSEPVTYIKIRLKGVVRTMVMKVSQR